jgi:hypothetical protein
VAYCLARSFPSLRLSRADESPPQWLDEKTLSDSALRQIKTSIQRIVSNNNWRLPDAKLPATLNQATASSRSDYRDGRTLRLNGWIMSQTECSILRNVADSTN